MYFIILCSVILNIYVYCDTEVSINSNVGQIRGSIRDEFTTFLGIPYGVVDDLNPFSTATKPPNFETPFLAAEHSPICPQITPQGDIEGDIQCLSLNIYTPNNEQNNNLPVMVFIHGGGFVEGSGNMETYDPKFLIRKNVIVITLNYRLGLYGFICLPDLGYSNQGVKDVILGLKWIKENIKAFGGDKDNILLFGHSAGSAMVDLILQYNKNNVFKKVILQSGLAISPGVASEHTNEDFLRNLAEKLNVDNTNLKPNEIIKEISHLRTTEVINATRYNAFSPCIDNFLNNNPVKENLKETKIVLGKTDKEILFAYYRDPTPDIDKIKRELSRGFRDLPGKAIEKVENFYTNRGKIDIMNFGTELYFQYPIERSIRYYLRHNATVYRYIFSYDGGRNYLKIRDNISAAGAAHADELGYLFDIVILNKEITPEDKYMIDALSILWTNFAKYGDPTPPLIENLPPVWPSLTQEPKLIMNLDYTIKMIDDPYENSVKFWDCFYDEYQDKLKGFQFESNCANITKSILMLYVFGGIL